MGFFFVVGSIALFATSDVSAFGGVQLPKCTKNTQMICRAHSDTQYDRRAVFKSAFTFAGIAAGAALVPNANAGSLLDENIETAYRKKSKSNSVPVVVEKKPISDMEPNLRSNYYYPTNKKRYLPRIKKCNDAIPECAKMIGDNDWEGAELFAMKIADDTILPLKLYTSSLLGGGTNVKVSFAEVMKKSSTDFEKAQKKLAKALAKQDQTKSSEALEELSTALLNYRTAGKLLGPDGGGDIPSVDEIRRSACRVQGRSFELKIQERDARLKG